MVATLERDTGGSDPYGDGESWTGAGTIDCTWWVTSGSENLSDHRAAVIAGEHLLVPLGTNIRSGDRVTSVIHHGDEIFGTDDWREVTHVAHQRRFLDCTLRAVS